jgi:hypothetical protein
MPRRDGAVQWEPIGASGDASVLRPAKEPFSPTGGLKLLTGNLGRSVIKVSAVPDDRHVIEAPARIFDTPGGAAESLPGRRARAGLPVQRRTDLICVVRWQGPQANGMPELHKLTPPLSVLQGKGFRVALVTDGRMSGASGKVPAAIHVSPEAAAGGPLALLRDGDVVRLDADAGRWKRWCRTSNGSAASRRASAKRSAKPMGTAWAASCSRPCAATRPKPKQERLHMVTRAPLTAVDVMRDAPVIPVIVIDDPPRRAAGARAGGRRHPHAGGDAAHPRRAGRHRGDRARGARRRGRRRHHPQRGRCAGRHRRRRPLRRQPRLHHRHRPRLPRAGLPLLPGVATGSEILLAAEDGYTELKFFPAMQAGGVPMLKAWHGPFHDVRFCPTGGVTPANAKEFLALPNVVCVGGSWLTPADAVKAGDWDRITQLARGGGGVAGCLKAGAETGREGREGNAKDAKGTTQVSFVAPGFRAQHRLLHGVEEQRKPPWLFFRVLCESFASFAAGCPLPPHRRANSG